jgi:large subunit ribosomal protein L17
MIHRRKGRKLKRTASHRKALLSNLAVSLIKSKKIITTVAKAKELRIVVEKLINKSKKISNNKEAKPEDIVHQKRIVYKFLKDRSAIKTLFDEIGPKVSERQGGYSRILKLGKRYGDAAELAVIELVDYNVEKSEQSHDKKSSKSKLTSKKKISDKQTSKAKKKNEVKEAKSDSNS